MQLECTLHINVVTQESMNFRPISTNATAICAYSAPILQKVNAYANVKCNKSLVTSNTIISIPALVSELIHRKIRIRLTQQFSNLRSKVLVISNESSATRTTHSFVVERHLTRATRKMENRVKWRRGRLGKIALGDARIAYVVQLSLGYRHD